jgi:lipoate synthase
MSACECEARGVASFVVLENECKKVCVMCGHFTSLSDARPGTHSANVARLSDALGKMHIAQDVLLSVMSRSDSHVRRNCKEAFEVLELAIKSAELAQMQVVHYVAMGHT